MKLNTQVPITNFQFPWFLLQNFFIAWYWLTKKEKQPSGVIINIISASRYVNFKAPNPLKVSLL